MLFEPRKTDVQLWRVGQIGASADQDHVAVRALEMDVGARVFAGDPFALARWQRNLAVDRQRELERDPRPSELKPRQPAGERALRRLPADPQRHVDSSGAQPPDALARGARVGILERDDDARRLGLEQQIGARRAAWAIVGTGLERRIDSRTLGAPSRFLERNRLGMRTAAGRGCASADDSAGGRNDDAADIRVGRALPARGLAELHGLGHEAAIVAAYMPSWFSSFWNCRCRSLIAASLAAWSFFWSAMIWASVRIDGS